MLKLREEANRCLLCADAPCSASCPHGQNPAGMVQALRFDNLYQAAIHTCPDRCSGCDAPCESACLHYDRPIRIRALAEQLPAPITEGVDLGITFCGVPCENPFFLSSSVVASS